jgi:ArsR family transcriptional regulator
MSKSSSPPSEAYDSLDRLYDDPEGRIDVLQEAIASDQEIADQTSVFKVLGNEDRIRILSVLGESECCGCELMLALDAPQSTIATHLRKLKDAGLVTCRKSGKWTYYRVTDTGVFELLDLAKAITEDV